MHYVYIHTYISGVGSRYVWYLVVEEVAWLERHVLDKSCLSLII